MMAKIPGPDEPVQYNKLDIVLEHICASIQMISIECNSFSTHVLVMACRELVLNLARRKSIELEWDHHRFIKSEHWDDYHKKVVLAYNYFKHADRDAEALYCGPSYSNLTDVNHAQTLFNIFGYQRLVGKIEKPMLNYALTMGLMYPKYFNTDFFNGYPEQKRQWESLSGDRSVCLSALRSQLEMDHYLPKIPEFP